jgi:hypothetical protein
VVVDGKVRKTTGLVRGTASTRVRIAKGRHTVVVRYLGSSTMSPAESSTIIVKGVKR